MSAHVETKDDSAQLGHAGDKVANAALLVGIAGVVASLAIALLGDSHNWHRLERSYVAAFAVILAISLGGLFWTMIQHAVKAGWSVVTRRICEAVAGNLIVVIPLMFIPVAIILWQGHLYHWIDPALTDPSSPKYDEVLAHKSVYLNGPFWFLRAFVFLGLWAGLAMFFRRNSVEQDATGDVSFTYRMQAIAPVGLLAFALTLTFAAVDWIMSINSHWFSTMFGVYFFAASCTGFFAVQIIIVYFLQRAGKLKAFTVEHYQDCGKLLFAFGMVFWAYIAYSQYMLIWYANIPEETTWYAARMIGGWQGVSILLLVGHFAVPFVLFVSKHPKRIPSVAVVVAMWMLLMHALDMYWLVMPEIPPYAMWDAAGESFTQLKVLANEAMTASEPTYEYTGFEPHLLDLTCLVGLGGFFIFATVRRLAAASLYPLQDPRLHESLAFENV